MKARPRWYVGYRRGDKLGRNTRETFRAIRTPTEQTHGARYYATVGPFRTRRGAEYMRDHGGNNPHVVTVAQAEYLAAKEQRSK